MKLGLFCLTTLLLLVAACAPKLRPVEVDYTRITVEEMERAVVELKVTNPNPFSLEIENLRYALLLADDTLARGARRMPVHIEAEDTTFADFPFTLEMTVSEIIERLPAILEDTISLDITGRYSLPSIFGPKQRPFRYRRAIPLADQLRKVVAPFEDLLDVDDWFRGDDE